MFVASPEPPDAGTYRGDAAVRWMTAWVESFEGHTIEATEIIDAGRDKVFVAILQRGRPRGSQTEVEGRWWTVMTLRGGSSSAPRSSPNVLRPSKPPGSGVDTSTPTAAIAEYRDGLLWRYKDYGESRLALEAAGLRE